MTKRADALLEQIVAEVTVREAGEGPALLWERRPENLVTGGTCPRCNNWRTAEEILGPDGPRIWSAPSFELKLNETYLRDLVIAGRVRCLRCQDEVAKLMEASPLHNADLVALCRNAVSGIRGRATKHWRRDQRQLATAIDYVDLLEQFIQQDGHCFLTGWEMTGVLNSGPTQAVVGRRNPHKGFSRSNAIFVCKSISELLDNRTVEEFHRLCEAVLQHRQEHREVALLKEITAAT